MSTKSVSIPAEVGHVIDLWRRFFDVATAFNAEIERLRVEDARVRSLEVGSLLRSSRYGSLVDIEEEAVDFRNVIVRLAEQAFAPAGAQLDIDVALVSKNCPAYDTEVFDPEALWAFLAGYYGESGEGAQKAYRDAARMIVSTFEEFWERNAGKPMKTVGGCPVLSMNTFWDPGYNGRGHYGSNYEDGAIKGMRALAAVAAWSGVFTIDETEVASFREALNCRGGQPPEPMAVGGNLQVRFYKSKIEFKLKPDFAESLRLFLAEFPK